MIKKIKNKANQAAQHLGRPVRLMEVCGTHTAAVSKFGLRSLFSAVLELRSGPGCPVCVTSAGDMERMIALSRIPGVTITTFGDMLRVPGLHTTLEKERASGASIKIVYSPADAAALAREKPEQEIIFLGVGFETTAPLVALGIQQAYELNIHNFSVYPANKIMPPAIDTLLNNNKMSLDGFILPGHVSITTGKQPFNFIGDNYGIPAVITGFTPVDILNSIYTLLDRIISKEPEVVNAYRWAVKESGNPEAQKAINNCFYCGQAPWRGFGFIENSGLLIKDKYSHYDAARRFSIDIQEPPEPKGCRCGELLQGLITPPECPLFARKCTPANPVGPCMVSSEGACAAYYQYEKN
ncbi:MAG: hydrogenase formation protein HypD [Clostridiales bacterium]|nr:hydrogenase formation protein HypD [Clostridiales bacterium]MCF8021806.1 hydrogenase formation protein HypD [Clostridiales bacterium]